MFNTFFRFVLSITAIAPVTGVMFLSIFFSDKNKLLSLPWLIGTILLWYLCRQQMKLAKNKAKVKDILLVKEFNRRDQGVIAFLFVSLLPFLRTPYPFSDSNLIVIFYVVVVIFMSIVDTGAYNFNPVLLLLGYKFYEVKDNEDMHHILILERNLTQSKKEISVNRISDNIWIERKP